MNLNNFIRQIDNYIIQVMPAFCGEVYEGGTFGLKWYAKIYMDFLNTNFLDNFVSSVETNMRFATPEIAMKYAEDHLEEYKNELNSEKYHIKSLDNYVKSIEEFKKEISKKNGGPEILSIDEFLDGDFYTDEGDYEAFVIYKDKVFTYLHFTENDIENEKPYTGLKNNKLSMMEVAAKSLGCKKEDITHVLFVDYPECK